MEEMFINENSYIAERRSIARAERARVMRLYRKVVFSALAIIIFIAIAFLITFKVKAGTDVQPRVKTFSSVEVKSGDTVWSIASAYYTDDYSSISDLADEICETNHISSNQITAGNYIIVPYYVSAEVQ